MWSNLREASYLTVKGKERRITKINACKCRDPSKVSESAAMHGVE